MSKGENTGGGNMCGVAIGVLCSLGVFILWVKADSGEAGSDGGLVRGGG